jgi:hypothetical protein
LHVSEIDEGDVVQHESNAAMVGGGQSRAELGTGPLSGRVGSINGSNRPDTSGALKRFLNVIVF